MPRNFLGISLAFPPRPDGMGGLAAVSGPDAVDDSIRAIITSLKGSHQFEPWMGLPSFIFHPVPDTTLIAAVIQEAIVNGDDRVDPASIEVNANAGGPAGLDSGRLIIQIRYRIKGTADSRTLDEGYRTIPAFA